MTEPLFLAYLDDPQVGGRVTLTGEEGRHAAQVRHSVFAGLDADDVAHLHRISDAILERIDPEGRRSLPYEG